MYQILLLFAISATMSQTINLESCDSRQMYKLCATSPDNFYENLKDDFACSTELCYPDRYELFSTITEIYYDETVVDKCDVMVYCFLNNYFLDVLKSTYHTNIINSDKFDTFITNENTYLWSLLQNYCNVHTITPTTTIAPHVNCQMSKYQSVLLSFKNYCLPDHIKCYARILESLSDMEDIQLFGNMLNYDVSSKKSIVNCHNMFRFMFYDMILQQKVDKFNKNSEFGIFVVGLVRNI